MVKNFLSLLVAFCTAFSTAIATNANEYDLRPYQNALNQIQTMQSRFVQVGPDGKKIRGTITLKRPGKMRIQYDTKKIELVSDGKNFVYKDKELAETTVAPLENTPAYVFLKKNVNFKKDAMLTGVGENAREISVTLRSKKGQNNGAIALFFNKKSRQLVGWTVIDTKNKQTTVTLLDPKTNLVVNESLFNVVIPKKR